MQQIKRYIPVFLAGVLSLLWGCSLNIPLEDEISGIDAIDNVQVAREALNAVYYGIPKNSMGLSMLSEDFLPTILIANSKGLLKYYRWAKEELFDFSSSQWNSYYSALCFANILLDSEQHIKIGTDDERVEWETIKGEAYALKALIYLDLLNLYSDRYAPTNPGIILKDRFEIGSSPRETADKCVAEINNLLQNARTMLKNKEYMSARYYHISYPAVVLLSARAALYEGDTDRAAGYCKELISGWGFKEYTPDESDYTNLWKNAASSEKLFAFYNDKQLNLSEYNHNPQLGDMIAIPDFFDYEPGDVRAGIATLPFEKKKPDGTVTAKYNLIGKYRLKLEDVLLYTNINCLRLAEAYFILAECQAADGDYDDARETVNKLLRRRGASEIDDTVTGEQLKQRIFDEKQREFVGEGLNYFELKRTGRKIRRFREDNPAGIVDISIEKDDYRWTLGIPLTELHENLNIDQNPEWQDRIN